MVEVQIEGHVEQIRERLALCGVGPASPSQEIIALVDEVIDLLSPPMAPAAREESNAELMAQVVGLGPLQPPIDDPEVEELWINSPSKVFVARSGVAELTTAILADQQVRDLAERMLHYSGRRLDLSSPFVDAMLKGDERLHVVIPPVAGRHWSVNIRKHVQKARSLKDPVNAGMLDAEMADFLTCAVGAGPSILVSGATQADKTMFLRALAGELSRMRRVISYEEVFELGPKNWDGVALQTRPGNIKGRGEVTLRDLVRKTLRMRPERPIVGEVRGPEALDLLLALNAGVLGMATVHANSAREALGKLMTLPLLAGENVTTDFIVPTLASSADLVCHVERDADGRRRVGEIPHPPGRVEGDRIEVSPLWNISRGRIVRGAGVAELAGRFAMAEFPVLSIAYSGQTLTGRGVF